MPLAASPVVIATALGLCGLATGAALAWISRRLPGRPTAPDPLPGRHLISAAAGAGLGACAGLSEASLAPAGRTAPPCWQLVVVPPVDGEHYWLPDRLTLPLLTTGLAAAALLDRARLLDSLVGAAAGFVGLWLIARAYRVLRGRDGLGGGDPFLLAGIGAWVGWIGLPGVLLWAAVAGLSVVAGRAVAGRTVSGSDRLPFGVFLALGGWLTWLLGPPGL